MGMGARLADVLKAKEKSQAELARISGVDEATISALIQRDSARSNYAPTLASALGISLHWLLTGEGDRDVSSVAVAETSAGYSLATQVESKYVMVRFLDATVSAGPGSLNEHEEVQGYIAFRREWLRRKGLVATNLVVVEVEGDSMSPSLEEGDAVLIDVTDREIRDGRIYAFRSHGEVRIKRFQRAANGTIVIASDNKSPRYRDEVLSPEQLATLDVIGRVVWGGGDK